MTSRRIGRMKASSTSVLVWESRKPSRRSPRMWAVVKSLLSTAISAPKRREWSLFRLWSTSIRQHGLSCSSGLAIVTSTDGDGDGDNEGYFFPAIYWWWKDYLSYSVLTFSIIYLFICWCLDSQTIYILWRPINLLIYILYSIDCRWHSCGKIGKLSFSTIICIINYIMLWRVNDFEF